jgi:hypothetical protein
MSFRRLIWFFSVSFFFIGGGWHLKVTGLSPMTRGDHFRFGSVFIKKNNQTEFKKKKNRNQFKLIGFGSVRFFRTKTGLARFSRFGSVFSDLTRFFSVFYRFRFGLVFSGFRLIKLEPNRSVFFKILIDLIGFFSQFGFFGYFFSVFSI